MVSPSTALKAQSALGMMFWMGMTAFPEALTSAYSLNFFDCPKAARGAAPCSVTNQKVVLYNICLLYTSPSPRDGLLSRMPSSA